MSVLLCPQEHFNLPCLVLSMETRLGQAAPRVVAMEAILAACPLVAEACLVHGDSSGAGGSSCCGHGGHSSRLPPCC